MERKGFTLIEVVVTMSVLSILLAAGLPAFATLLERQRAAAAMSSLVSQMSHARFAAVKYRRPTMLCPSTNGLRCNQGGDWSSGWMMFVDRGDRQGPATASDLLQVELTPRSRQLRIRSSAGRSYLRYMPDGRSAGTNLTIQVCNQQGTLLGAVIVNNAGRPRTELGRGESPCTP